ncbi:hypothetical protein CYMTET_17231 [Cymbomonas tetramitiformis]|uniref:Uncharacterized protein n=1 Tax=Cymbomonas tetramitiformis TaxID=36881 RepID=A0AAE0L756_9CHLO|nr:hypothetical protein CYMTET_17231 [Cymbomonas tetramitiformis]
MGRGGCNMMHDQSQDIFNETDGRSTWNHLVNAVLKYPTLRADYLERLRDLQDRYLTSGWLQNEAYRMRDRIAAAAHKDNEKWDCGDIYAGTEQLVGQMWTRKAQLEAFFNSQG